MLINFYCSTSHVYYFRLEIYNKTITGFRFTLTLIILHIAKTSSNNCLIYLQTNRLRKGNQFFRCLDTTGKFWFIELYNYVELPETVKDLS